MKVLKLLVRYILNPVLGFVYYPLMEWEVAGIRENLDGSAYTIQEPELSSYK